MASTMLYFYSVGVSLLRRTHRPLQLRVRSCNDEGSSSDLVVANLRVLRERIEQVKLKERLESCYMPKIGWNYTCDYTKYTNKSTKLPKNLELLGLVSWVFSLTIGSGTLGLLIVSFLVQINQ